MVGVRGRMELEIRTILVMVAILALMLSGLLALAGLYVGGIRGIWHWAAANLCISIGIGTSYFFDEFTPGYVWAVVVGSTLMAAGISLQFTGIRQFSGKPSHWRVALALCVLVCLLNVWFRVIHPEPSARAMANAVLFTVGYVACARELLIRIESPQRTAYWVTGASFAFMAVLMITRLLVIGFDHQGDYALFENTAINQASFFLGILIQLCVTFGFVLMINYRLIADIQKIASRDGLTGVFNRRRLEEEAARLVVRCGRTGDALTVMMLDVDHFKEVNDLYGHQTGDEVLKRLAAVAQASVRTDDYLARYGGEEFCILLLATTEEDALSLAERLRRNYEDMEIVYSGKTIRSTISIGVADSSHVGLDFEALVAAADLALYRAKEQGRNRVVAHSSLALAPSAS
ncbi:GGDEF domain-containing protein, partial [Fundidesulfovibrio putealis]|uniref:GGDEF domain-containing protein n=1 Tax=Fundidesulfovibrio putealis TaxID=270496 RepID=UPI0004061942